MGAFDLILRVGWVLTISPFVINSDNIWPLLFVMIISFIEIFRRGVWNTLKLEYEHIKNCGAYQATIEDKDIYESAKKQADEVMQNQNAGIGSEKHLRESKTAKSNSSTRQGENFVEMRIKRQL